MSNNKRFQNSAYQSSRIPEEMPLRSFMDLPESVIWRILLLSALIYLVWTDKIAIVMGAPGPDKKEIGQKNPGKAISTSMLGLSLGESKMPAETPAKQTLVYVELPSGPMTNLTPVIDPQFARRYGLPEEKAKPFLGASKQYVDTWAELAVAEMQRTGIPASITLAQGLLESNAGDSKLAQRSNNHFGIKCFSSHCKKGHCVNFTDDSHKDFFVRYATVKGSYQAHSDFLRKSARFRHLLELEPSDYKAWARGLAKAGYATDKKYAEKLIAIIHNLGLHQYDRMQ